MQTAQCQTVTSGATTERSRAEGPREQTEQTECGKRCLLVQKSGPKKVRGWCDGKKAESGGDTCSGQEKSAGEGQPLRKHNTGCRLKFLVNNSKRRRVTEALFGCAS